jgi:hypothetical protein
MGKLAVIVLGHRDAGKTTTWDELFGSPSRTRGGRRQLTLSDERTVPVFLVPRSPEEQGKYVGDLVDGAPSIVLCSVQYVQRARGTFDFFLTNNYRLYVQWLNPGHHDPSSYADKLGFGDFLLHEGATLSVRSGRVKSDSRIREIRDFITGWAFGRRVKP